MNIITQGLFWRPLLFSSSAWYILHGSSYRFIDQDDFQTGSKKPISKYRAANHNPKPNIQIDIVMDENSNSIDPNNRDLFTEYISIFSSKPKNFYAFLWLDARL